MSEYPLGQDLASKIERQRLDERNQPTTISPIIPFQNPAPSVDPFAPDAPILDLLSLSSNPLLATASEDQLRALVQRLRATAAQPATLKAEMAKTSAKPSIAAKKKALLDAV